MRKGVFMKIGILGTGIVAGKMARTITGLKEAENYAVASRDIRKAEAFRREYEIKKAYGSYEELAADPEVDLIYIATPHSQHYENAKLCLKYKKPLLVEKAFTVNAGQAEELLAIAKENRIFITEALWTRYMPMRKKLEDILQRGSIGNVTSLTANLGYPLHNLSRLTDPQLAGGALLDVGVYPINFASMVFGERVTNITSSVIKTITGVDAQNSMVLSFDDQQLAVLHSNITARTDGRGIIHGDKGFIVVENINNWEQIRVYDTNRNELACFDRPEQITGYEYELLASIRAIQDGKIECEEMPHKETLRIMKMMDGLRTAWGLKYPCE